MSQDEIELINLLDNTFDDFIYLDDHLDQDNYLGDNEAENETNSNYQDKRTKKVSKELYSEFGQENDNSNVIIAITPKYINHDHFDKVNYPTEVYNVTFLDTSIEEIPACDIHIYALETHKYTYEHNKQLSHTTQDKKIGFVYARCSKSNDISIETQRKTCFKYAQDNNIELLSFGYQYDDGISARNMNNLNYELGFWTLDYLPNNSHLIVYSVDRLSRHLLLGMQYLEELKTRNISIHFVFNDLCYSVGMSDDTKSKIQHELQIAEEYSNITSARVKASRQRMKDEGHQLGNAPYGYKHVYINNIRKRVINTEEYNNIQNIVNKYNNFTHTDKSNTKKNKITLIVKWCNTNGIYHRKNKKFTHNQINYIITKYNTSTSIPMDTE